MKIRTYSTVILDVIFCGCEAWCFTLRLRVLGIGHYLENMDSERQPFYMSPLPPWHGAFSGFGLRRGLPDLEGSSRYIE
jgi:hypothetical protein